MEGSYWLVAVYKAAKELNSGCIESQDGVLF